MAEYRVDYVTNEGKRGVWEFEREYESLEEASLGLVETLAYAKKRMPDINHLILVELVERDVLVYPGEAP